MDRYGSDVLSQDPHLPVRRVAPTIPAEYGLVVECAETGFCGSVVRIEKDIEGRTVELEDRHGTRRLFVMTVGGFLIDGDPVTLVPASSVRTAPARTASGSVAAGPSKAQVARASRIWVEGVHDAELIEKVWGEDLRAAAIVVEPLHGADDLVGALADFGPSPTRKVGVLLDHMVPNSKETRIAEDAISEFEPFVHVIGHPFVDIWQAVKPSAIGVAVWPTIPRGQPWKAGIISALGWREDERLAWKRILAQVNSYADLEPSLLGRVEELIDFVTVDE
ncbi:MAG: DUF3097 domain-containing protein [Actinobacteria bacterium]|nr:DUF3097 domain-containing protein [Actinomycetota bacterium]